MFSNGVLTHNYCFETLKFKNVEKRSIKREGYQIFSNFHSFKIYNHFFQIFFSENEKKVLSST